MVVDDDEDVQIVSALPDSETMGVNADGGGEASSSVPKLPKNDEEKGAVAGGGANATPGSPKGNGNNEGDNENGDDNDNENDIDIELNTEAFIPALPERSPSPPSALDASSTDFLSAPVLTLEPDSTNLTLNGEESLSHAHGGANNLFFGVVVGGDDDALNTLEGGGGGGPISPGDSLGHTLDSLMETDLIIPDTEEFVNAAAAAGFDADEALQGVILTGDVDDLMNTTTTTASS